MLLGANPLISVTPGLMIWTIVCFLITLYVLKRFAFGPIQKMIDERREQIRQSIEAADAARDESRKLLEEHRQLIAQARGEAEAILTEARRTGESMEQRMREETEADRQRRIEETRKEIAAETARALEQIRAEVAELTLEAASRVVGRSLSAAQDRELIAEAVGSLDFSRLEETV
jgi:F-type H+-transporting ATPase subunit b